MPACGAQTAPRQVLSASVVAPQQDQHADDVTRRLKRLQPDSNLPATQAPFFVDLLQSPRYRWQLAVGPKTKPGKPGESGVPPGSLAADLINLRRHHLAQEFERTFSDRPLQDLPDPSLLKNLDRAASRVSRALVNDEPVVIFGDYDVDGTVSCSMLRRFLGEYGLSPQIHIPNRLTEGYGLNVKGVETVARQGARVIVTVDNGISAREACERARQLGIDVIVTDHHEPPAQLPDAFAIVNPKQHDCLFPYKHLAGVGVAYFFLIALRRELARIQPGIRPNLRHYLDYVAIGTIADVCPLTGLNHMMTRLGLAVLDEHLRGGRRPGLAALLRVAGADPGSPVTAEQIAFQVGPRLNAAGRLGAALATEEILSTTNPTRAHELASALDAENRQRRELERQTFRELCSKLESVEQPGSPRLSRGIVSYDANWHPGVLGIVASRCVERFYTPSLVLCAHEGIVKGSGRSTDEIDLFELLDPHRAGFLAFGGHAKAVGFSLQPDRIDWLRETLEASLAARKEIAQVHKPALKIDAEIPLYNVSESLVEELAELEPFGSGNNRPRFLLRNVVLEECQTIGKNPDDGHCRVYLSQHGQRCAVPFTGFSLRQSLEETMSFAKRDTGAPDKAHADQLHVVIELSFGYWKGRRKLELRICDFATAPAAQDDRNHGHPL